MNYLPLSDADRAAMMAAAGVTEEELFGAVPAVSPPAIETLSESEILADLAPLAQPVSESRIGLGLGGLPIPTAVDAITSRGEFVTAYTPYQPECSQGTLTAIFEFQTRVSRMTGLPVSNAGLYDGSTALVEAVRMGLAETGRTEIVVARSVAPAWREVLATHFGGRPEVTIVEAPFDTATGRLQPVSGIVGERTGAFVAASPNVFGVLERDISQTFSQAAAVGAVPIQVFHPVAASILPTPAVAGAEIAVAEGQPLGIPLWAGGPYLGLMAASRRFLRRMPGRMVGRTVDAEGRDAFVLTLQTREQHIRRERATSNICTNQALMALRATVFLALLGDEGVRSAARKIRSQATIQSEGKRLFSGEIFNEYAIRGDRGLPIDYPELGPVSIVGVGE